MLANHLLQFTITATDVDNDTLIYSASNLPAGASFDSVTHVFSWTPDIQGNYTGIRFSVSDGKLSDTEDITITVSPQAYTLSTTVNGQGSITRSPDKAAYYEGDIVTLTATAAAGWAFSSWSDDPSILGNQRTITITGSTAITANFTQDRFTITTHISGSGHVDKTPDQATYSYGDTVTLTATAGDGWTFQGWSGAISGTNNPYTFVITSDAAITATFNSNNSNNDSTGESGGGGSVGGGGGGSGAAGMIANSTGEKRITGLWGWTNSNGMLLDSIEAYSVDEFVKLNLPSNTICLNAAGMPLPTLSITMLYNAPDGVPTNGLMGNIYSFWPEGATISPAVPLTFRYDPKLLAPGEKEENIKVTWWDKGAGKWGNLATIIDTKKHTATAYISHFSIYSLMMETPSAEPEATITQPPMQEPETTIAPVEETAVTRGDSQAVEAPAETLPSSPVSTVIVQSPAAETTQVLASAETSVTQSPDTANKQGSRGIILAAAALMITLVVALTVIRSRKNNGGK